MTPNETTLTMQAEELTDEQISPRRQDPLVGVLLIESLTSIAREKLLIAKVAGFAMVVGLGISLVLPVRYTATTSIMTPQQTQSSAAMLMNQLVNPNASSLAAAASAGLGLRNPNDLYIGLLDSRTVTDAIIQKYELMKVYKAADMTAARKELSEHTSVTSEKSGLIAISVTEKDKARAADLANDYTAELRNLTKTLAVTEAAQRRLFYDDQLKRAKDDLIAAQVTFQKIRQGRGLIQLDAQTRSLLENLAVLHAQVAAKQVELQALRSYSTEQNPSVQLAENQLSTLQAQVARLDESNNSSTPSKLGLEDVSGAGVDYLRAEHELQYRQTLFDLLVRQYDAARLDEAKDAAVIQVVVPATPPDRKSSPHRAQIVIMCTLLGIFAALFYLFIRNGANRNPDLYRSLIDLKSAMLGR
jgi:uncharacterized protein involved in exopolysaccharide biosynthesis